MKSRGFSGETTSAPSTGKFGTIELPTAAAKTLPSIAYACWIGSRWNVPAPPAAAPTASPKRRIDAAMEARSPAATPSCGRSPTLA